MQDPLGIVVSVDYRAIRTTLEPAALPHSAGKAFILGESRFESLRLDEALYKEAQSLIYPKEPHDTQLLLCTVTDKIRGKIDRFGLRTDVTREILLRLAALEQELGAG